MKKSVINLDKLHLVLLGIILVGGILFWINHKNTPPPHLHNPYQQQLDSLSSLINEYRIENNFLEKEYIRYVSISSEYLSQIDSLKDHLEINKKYYEKQIKNLDTFTSTELYDFITSRYK